jgi:perosamine synthetase
MRQDKNLSIEGRFLSALTQVLPGERPISLHEPVFSGNDWAYVKECIDTGWVSSVGKFVDEFEKSIAEITGARHVVATVNGTSALQIGLNVAGVLPGDEVLVPALSFVATANAVSHCGAIPHFVDVSEISLGMDPAVLRDYLQSVTVKRAGALCNRESGRKIAAFVPVHAFGHPAQVDELSDISEEFSLPMVEDAAESLGSYLHGRHTGTTGLCGALSFNGNKIVTTGGGGALLFSDKGLADRAKHLTTTAKKSHRWEFNHDEVAWNYRLPNLNAALGCSQLERLDDYLTSKRLLAEKYKKVFLHDPDFRFVVEPKNSKSNYWLSTVALSAPSLSTRNRLLECANENGFLVRPAWNLLNKLPMYEHMPSAPLSVAERMSDALINLPSGSGLIMESEK